MFLVKSNIHFQGPGGPGPPNLSMLGPSLSILLAEILIYLETRCDEYALIIQLFLLTVHILKIYEGVHFIG
jgi:hypothetical protein